MIFLYFYFFLLFLFFLFVLCARSCCCLAPALAPTCYRYHAVIMIIISHRHRIVYYSIYLIYQRYTVCVLHNNKSYAVCPTYLLPPYLVPTVLTSLLTYLQYLLINCSLNVN